MGPLALHRPMRFRPVRAVAALLTGFTAAAAAFASAPAAPPASDSPSEIAARCLTRVALADLRIVAGPKVRDYQVTAELLEVAHALSPDDTTLLRLLIEAHANGENPDRVDELTRDLLRLDPADTVAQLRLISTSLRRLQSVEQRLAAYDRWLGKAGESVDASVRSRLALDAALLSRETGDADGFVRRLSRAVELDSTNKDAAVLALTFFSQRIDDPVGRLELMLGVLKADPIDPDAHYAIARHLAAQGAFKGAARFFDTGRTIRGTLGFQSSSDEDLEVDILRWHLQGPRAVVDNLNRGLSDIRDSYVRQREALVREKQPVDSVPDPSHVRLTMANEWLRLLATLALDDDDLLRPAFEEMVVTAHQQIEELENPATREEGMTDEQVADRIRGLRAELIAMRLWTGRELDQAAQALDVLRADPAADPIRIRRLDALAKLRSGQADTAEQALRDLGPDDDLAQLWLCVAAQTRADKAAAAAQFADFARAHAGTLFGAYAYTRAERLAGSPPAPVATTAKLEQLAAEAPRWIESFVASPRRFTSLSARVEPLEARMLDPVRMTITLGNISPIPLGVGPDRPISSRLLIAPDLQVATEPVATSSLLQVQSLERRLRLLPREEFETVISPDAGMLGTTLDLIYTKPVRVRYTILQAFELTQSGAYDAGPYGLSAQVGPVIRPASIKINADVAAMTRWAEAGTPRELIETIILLRGRSLPITAAQPLTPDEQRAIFDAAARRFPQLSPEWQIALLALAPPAVSSAKLLPAEEPAVLPLDVASQASTDPRVRTIVAALRTASPSDPFLTALSSDENPRLQALARNVQGRLSEGTRCYASFDSTIKTPNIPTDGAGSLATPSNQDK